MQAPALPPHLIRSEPRDLEAFATIWRWEGVVRRLLPRVLDESDLEVHFQAVFDIRPNVRVLRGYEAYARFPSAPRIPTGLWFAIADHMDLGRQLELATGRQALHRLDRLPGTTILFVNAGPEAAIAIAESAPPGLSERIVFDLPGRAFSNPGTADIVDRLRIAGFGVCFDDGPAAADTRGRVAAAGDRLDFVKLDILKGVGWPQVEEVVSQVANWCHRNGAFLVAKRAEDGDELCLLRQAGVDWAQGHALSRPLTL